MKEELKAYGGDVAKFCCVCGKELVRKNYVKGFDKYTGKKLIYTMLSCPNVLPHISYDFDEKGNEIIERYP